MPYDNEKRIMVCDNCSLEMSYDRVNEEYPRKEWTCVNHTDAVRLLVFCSDCWERDITETHHGWQEDTGQNARSYYSLSECDRLDKMVRGVIKRLKSNA